MQSRPKRCLASPEKQSQARDQIRKADPIKNAVKLLLTDWVEVEEVEDTEGKPKLVTVDNTPQNTAKLKGWIDLAHKIAPNLRHSTQEVNLNDNRGVSQLSDIELTEQLAKRYGMSTGTGSTKPN